MITYEKKQKIGKVLSSIVNNVIQLHLNPEKTGVEITVTPSSYIDNQFLLTFSVDGYRCIEKKYSFVHMQHKLESAIKEIADLCEKAKQIKHTIQYYKLTVDNYQAIDMGTGILWANKNIGADRNDTNGQLFAWGEIEDKCYESNYNKKNTFFYDRPHYKFVEGEKQHLTKYNRYSTLHQPDNKTRLEPADDAATQLMGQQWRMPTWEEFQTLLKSCDIHFVRTPSFARDYYVLESRINGRMLVFPSDVRYWTSDLSDKHDTCAHAISYQWTTSNGRRWRPMYIRAVCNK